MAVDIQYFPPFVRRTCDGSTTVEQVLGYALMSNKLDDVTTDSVLTRKFVSDGAGNVIEDTDVLGTTTTHYGYNDAG
jgi:hypothetical protein